MPQVNEYGPVVFMAVAVLWMAKDVLINVLTKRNGSSAGNGNGNGSDKYMQQVIQNNTSALSSLDATIREHSATISRQTEKFSELQLEVARIRKKG